MHEKKNPTLAGKFDKRGSTVGNGLMGSFGFSPITLRALKISPDQPKLFRIAKLNSEHKNPLARSLQKSIYLSTRRWCLTYLSVYDIESRQQKVCHISMVKTLDVISGLKLARSDEVISPSNGDLNGALVNTRLKTREFRLVSMPLSPCMQLFLNTRQTKISRRCGPSTIQVGYDWIIFQWWGSFFS